MVLTPPLNPKFDIVTFFFLGKGEENSKIEFTKNYLPQFGNHTHPPPPPKKKVKKIFVLSF